LSSATSEDTATRLVGSLVGSVGIIATLIWALNFVAVPWIHYANWVWHIPDPPGWRLGIPCALFFVSCLAFRKASQSVALAGICTAILTALYLSFRFLPHGDYWDWVVLARSDRVLLSELFSTVTYRILALEGVDRRYVPVLFGIASFVTYLGLARILLREAPDRLHELVLLYPSFGFSYLFFFGHFEHTFLGVPFLLAHLSVVLLYLRQDPRSSPGKLVLSAFLLAVACLFHGQFIALAPAMPLILLVRFVGLGAVRTGLKLVAYYAITLAAVVAIGIGIVALAGFHVDLGNVSGGGDQQLLVPLSAAASTRYTRFLMLSPAHAVEVANIIVHAAPLGILMGFVVLVQAWRRGHHARFRSNSFVLVTGIYSLGYLALVMLWNFDLGANGDIDLMLSMSAPLALFWSCIAVAEDTLPRGLIPVIAALGTAANVALMQILIEPRF
jgi:hypothetical protein